MASDPEPEWQEVGAKTMNKLFTERIDLTKHEFLWFERRKDNNTSKGYIKIAAFRTWHGTLKEIDKESMDIEWKPGPIEFWTKPNDKTWHKES